MTHLRPNFYICFFAFRLQSLIRSHSSPLSRPKSILILSDQHAVERTRRRHTRMDKSQTIIIVGGCGTFGLSTAWHLTKRGYTNIICLDRWMFPSRSSAGFDRNKIVRSAYGNALYATIAEEAIQLWKQPLFKDVFHCTGWVAGTTAPPLNAQTNYTSNSISAVGEYDSMVHTRRFLMSAQTIKTIPDSHSLRKNFPDFFGHARDGFRGMFDGNAGWVDSARALEIVGMECQKAGVKFIGGLQGTVKSILRSQAGSVTGVLTENGSVFKADKIVLCVGAYSESLIDMEGQVTAVAYSTTHIALTSDELRRYKDMPVIWVEGLGYAFPPDKTGHIKFCDLHIGHPWKQSVLDRSRPISLPRDAAYHTNDTLPEEDIEEVRRFIRFTMPQFSGRPFARTAMCWDTESFDYGWIIGAHPSSPNHLFVATAGSGHSFKNLPNVGRFVVDTLEGCLEPKLRETWRWRPDRVSSVAPTPRVDLNQLHGWQHDQLSEDISHRYVASKL